jgi:hypothetical protein
MLLKSAIGLALFAPLFATDAVPAAPGLTVHEWGTFTSVAAEDGTADPWVLLTPPADLPCFVYHLSAQCIKCSPARVRMETPVIYFYSNTPLTADVHVDLPSGVISEWYPQASQVSRVHPGYTYGNGGNIEWHGVQVSPGADQEFPTFGDGSHYYAARNTDAAPLVVGDQPEKVLFYRGIANFDIDALPRYMPDGKLELRNSGHEPLAFAILFENRGGRIGYRVIRDLRGKVWLDSPELTGDVESVHRELADALTAAGLYPKEAAAMIETWRDSWFEEGTRIFYLVPRKTVDTVLPIRITPTPGSVERVFVGRVEVLAPWRQQMIETALATGDVPTLRRCGRFLGPFSQRIIQGRSPVRISQAASNFLSTAGRPPAPSNGSPCQPVPAVLPTGQR